MIGPQFIEVDGRRHVKVRVAVMVDSDGRWQVAGSETDDRQTSANEVAGLANGLHYDHVRRIYFLYAAVPVPDADGMPVIGAEMEWSP